MSRRKRTAAEKRARRERKKQFATIFINGEQKRVPRPPLIEMLTVEGFVARNADPIWLHENELWEYLEVELGGCGRDSLLDVISKEFARRNS